MFEKVILNNLVHNEVYTRKVLPFLVSDYFKNASEKLVFEKIKDFVTRYNICPTKEALAINISNSEVGESLFEEVINIVSGLEKDDNSVAWLYDETEKFCQKQALYNAIYKAIDIAEGEVKDLDSNAIPGLLMEALSITFDANVGHDYWDDAEAQWQHQHSLDTRHPFSLNILNQVTKGGVKEKTLNCISGEEEFVLYIQDVEIVKNLVQFGAYYSGLITYEKMINVTHLHKIRIKAEDLFKGLNLNDPVNKNEHEIYVDTPSGLQPIINFYNMGNKEIYEVKLENGDYHKVAKNHRYMDEAGNETEAYEAKNIQTRTKVVKVVSNEFDRIDKTYDIEIPYPNWYYGSQDIVQHNCVLAPINGGKSIHLIQQAADWLLSGDDVLYISMEMDEATCRERIDVVTMDMTFDTVMALEKQQYLNRINDIRSKTKGKLVVKEFPAGSAHVGHFRHLLQELKIKKNFIPKLICVDYLTICASAKLPSSAKGNTNTYFTSVAEEMRAFAQEVGVPVWTAVQFDRATQGASDAGLGNVGLAIGIAATADFMFAILIPDELASRGQVIGKIIKNRYSSYKGRFLLGLNPDKQKFYDIDQTAVMTSEELSELGLSNLIPEGTKVMSKATSDKVMDGWNFG